MRYIHYGSKIFSRDIFEPISKHACLGNKPIWGGLWGTPESPKNIDWKTWCIDNNFDTYKLDSYFIFSISNNSKIFKVSTINDVYKLKELIGEEKFEYSGWDILNFNKLQNMGYDGIEVEINNHDIYMELYGWDVDSILIFNPNVIILE